MFKEFKEFAMRGNVVDMAVGIIIYHIAELPGIIALIVTDAFDPMAGIGAAIAREVAPRASGLALLARREDRLEALSAELRAAHPSLQVAVVPVDGAWKIRSIEVLELERVR